MSIHDHAPGLASVPDPSTLALFCLGKSHPWRTFEYILPRIITYHCHGSLLSRWRRVEIILAYRQRLRREIKRRVDRIVRTIEFLHVLRSGYQPGTHLVVSTLLCDKTIIIILEAAKVGHSLAHDGLWSPEDEPRQTSKSYNN